MLEHSDFNQSEQDLSVDAHRVKVVVLTQTVVVDLDLGRCNVVFYLIDKRTLAIAWRCPIVFLVLVFSKSRCLYVCTNWIPSYVNMPSMSSLWLSIYTGCVFRFFSLWDLIHHHLCLQFAFQLKTFSSFFLSCLDHLLSRLPVESRGVLSMIA